MTFLQEYNELRMKRSLLLTGIIAERNGLTKSVLFEKLMEINTRMDELVKSEFPEEKQEFHDTERPII